MKVIGKTNTGYIIEATNGEVEDILSSTGVKYSKEKPIDIGTNIPALDYAAMIRKCIDFKKTYDFEKFEMAAKSAMKIVQSIKLLNFGEES